MLHASNRRRKLFIPSLKVRTGLATTQQCKEEVVFNHFVNLLGQTHDRSAALNRSHLGYERQDLSYLEEFFEDEEINVLFAWLISHQPAVLFSQNKPATSNQPAVLFSQNKPTPAISHQPNEQAVKR
jgi:hypothetical protein